MVKTAVVRVLPSQKGCICQRPSKHFQMKNPTTLLQLDPVDLPSRAHAFRSFSKKCFHLSQTQCTKGIQRFDVSQRFHIAFTRKIRYGRAAVSRARWSDMVMRQLISLVGQPISLVGWAVSQKSGNHFLKSGEHFVAGTADMHKIL